MKRSTTTLDDLVALLNDGQFHSGNALGEALSISRTAVWKHLNFLQTQGIDLHVDKHRGYRLAHPPFVLLNVDRILQHISSVTMKADQIALFTQLPSTADYIKQLSSHDRSLPSICLAEQQTQGRGRSGKLWHSPFGQNIYFSSVWRIDQDVSQLAGLSLAIGIALIRLLHRHQLNDVLLKWPNDLYWHDHKLSGVLIEVAAQANHQCHLFISFGLNVNMPIAIDTLQTHRWTSMHHITGQHYDRNVLIAHAIDQLADAIHQFSAQGLTAFSTELKHYDYLYNKPICLSSSTTSSLQGIAKGIDEQGYLLLQTDPTQPIQRLNAGEVSVMQIGDSSH
ncbi:MAG: biotin--[acetyl-CoA-carboxylase] ligase [Legionellales bacterium]|nr:biotin--[acetyl-CoA-carboxylase] ligase [Legionellales bacterium]